MTRVDLRDVPAEQRPAAFVTIAAVLLVAVLRWWRTNAPLSIFTGTAFHVLAVDLAVQ